MRLFLKGLDALVRAAYGVRPFCQAPDCLLRWQLGRAPRDLSLPDGLVPRHSPVIWVHLWNERLPPMPPEGADWAWALQMRRRLVQSFRYLARRLASDPTLEGIRAIGGAMIFLAMDRRGSAALMHRLGFTTFLSPNPLGPFGAFWENLYSWGIMWAFNPASWRRHPFRGVCRYEVWMSREAFVAHYAPCLAADVKTGAPANGCRPDPVP